MLDCTLPPSVNHRSTISLPPSVKHGWLSLPPSVRHGWLSLPPSIRHGWFSLPPSVRHGWHSLPPLSRTPCPVVTNVLDIQHLHLKTLYTVHFSWMNIAVCKQVSGSLTLDIVCIWKLTQSWTLYHFVQFHKHIYQANFIISSYVTDLLMWQKNYHNVLLTSTNIELGFFLWPILLFVLSRITYFTPRLNSNVLEVMQMMESSSSLK